MIAPRRLLFTMTFTLMAFALGAGVTRAETIDGRVRLGFDGAVLQHTTMGTIGSIDAMLPFPSDDTTSITLAAASFGAVLGYATSEHFMVGTRLAYTHSRESYGTQGTVSAQGFDGDISCAHVFGRSALRPFLGPLLGYRSQTSDVFSASGLSEHWFTIGARVGLHAFAAPSFSIDPSLMVGYATGSGELPSGIFPGGPSGYTIDGFVIGLHVAISGWLGGTATDAR